jgi:DNA-binding MarR family transcriptional regulator
MEYHEGKKLGRFNALMNEFEAFYHEIAVKCGLSDSGYEIMRAIMLLGEGCTQTNIYKNSYLNKQTVNSSVKQLVKKGLIFLEQGKGREYKLHLTDIGREYIELRILPVESAENEIFEELTEDEYDELIRLTEKYLDSFRKKIRKIDNLQVNTGENSNQ